MCGAETIVNYSMDIFKRAEVQVPHYLLTILVNLAFLAGYIISVFLTTSLKRKVQFLIGVILMSISQAILGLALKAEVGSYPTGDIQIKRQSIYVSATISLVMHYHNISGKAFILTECYKRFSSNTLPEFLL